MKIVSAVLRDIFDMLIGILLFGILFAVFCKMLASPILLSDAASEEVGVERARSPVEASCAETEEIPEEKSPCVLTVYREGDGPRPAWYDPTEKMSVEWVEEKPENDIARLNYDWNTLIYGWDGHSCERWEFELFVKITYLEFWGTSVECCRAGADSILNLWDSGYFSDTLGGTLSATAENGARVYTTYNYVFDWNYDEHGLNEIRAICIDRFVNAPQYDCEFFQLYFFPSWASPCFIFDGVYFSTFKR